MNEKCLAGRDVCEVHYDKALDGPISAEWQCPEHDQSAPHHTDDGSPCDSNCEIQRCGTCAHFDRRYPADEMYGTCLMIYKGNVRTEAHKCTINSYQWNLS